MNIDSLFGEAGQVGVMTTSGVGASPEYYAEEICNRLLEIAKTASPEIRLQAEAFREAMRAHILHGIRDAIRSDHTTVINHLRKAGMNEAAALVYELNRR